MSEKELNKKAFEQAEKELFDKRVKIAKDYILQTLEKIEEKKKEKAKVEEELRVLKLDLEDIRKGNFKSIEERVEKSSVAQDITVIPYIKIIEIIREREKFEPIRPWGPQYPDPNIVWCNAMAGTYNLSDGKSMYLSA
jgi:hypothetical protein